MTEIKQRLFALQDTKYRDLHSRLMPTVKKALVKQYETAVKYLEQDRLDIPTHNRTIQKAVDSFRIDEEKKRYLKKLRRK